MEDWQFWTLVVIGTMIVLALAPTLSVIISAICGYAFMIAIWPLMICGALYWYLDWTHDWYSNVMNVFLISLVVAVPSLIGWIGFALYAYACDRKALASKE
jgi:hypothetical protein